MPKQRPEIGTVLYFVGEHRYYIEGRAAPNMEYCVLKGTLKEYFEGGYVEMKIAAKNPNGYSAPYYYKLSEIGKRIFYTFAEAAQYAEKLSDYEDEHWRIPFGDEPIRRPWKEVKQ